MKKIQWPVLKILVILGFILFSGNLVFGQISGFRLRKADSLFTARQYTQSMEHYREVLKNNQYTPAMLLKMAYIQEGLDEIGQALYFLNLYYIITKDTAALEKMEELAAKYHLTGYADIDSDRAWSLYEDYRSSISISLAVIITFLFSLAIFLKRKKHVPVSVTIVLMVFVLLLGVHINFGDRTSTAIVAATDTYLMSGPSSGASVVSIIADGHRLEVTGKTDVWLKVNWEGRTAYIKENNVLTVAL